MTGSPVPPLDDLASWAVLYAEVGWSVFPLQPGGKAPATRHGVLDATADIVQVVAWWERDWAQNIGLACGPSGVVVLDVDHPAGEASLAGLVPPPPPTLVSMTGGGGMHWIYRVPLNEVARNTAGRLGAGLDTRGDGGYIVLPPSIHPSGRPYEWMTWADPRRHALAPAPAYLLASQPPPRRPPAVQPGPRYLDGDGTRWGVAALNGVIQDLQQAQPGTRHAALIAASLRIGSVIAGGQLDEAAARAALVDAGNRMYEATGERPDRVEATIDGGFLRGRLEPAVPPVDGRRRGA